MWDEGSPIALIAEELGRTKGAILTRLRTQGSLGKVTWSSTAKVGDADKKFVYVLAAIPPALWTDIDRFTDCLTLDEWQVDKVDEQTLRVVGEDVDALVGIDSASGLLMGDATSRWLLVVSDQQDGAVPAGVDGVVVPALAKD